MTSLSIAILLILSAGLQPALTMSDFSSINLLRKDNPDSSFRSKNSVHKPPRCSVDEMGSVIGIRELQEIVEHFAERANISPFMVLKKLFERMRNRKNSDDMFLNTLEGTDLQQMLRPKLDGKPTLSQRPQIPNVVPYEVPPGNHEPKKPFLVVPHHVSPSSDNGRPTITRFVPLRSPFNRPFVPPETALVRVTTLPDIPITISPRMTVAEALQQADNEYRVGLGIKVKFGFGRRVVRGIECIVIKNILNLFEGKEPIWNITVADKNGQVIYHGICLPDDNVRIKPGTDINISYMSLLD